ncbi:MAG: hypothetical protein WD847_01230 [Pirellulales bacterium]
MNQRPGGLTAVCVLAIVLGALGLLTGLVGIVGMLAAPAMQNLFSGMPGMNDEFTKVQMEMNAEMMAVAQSRPVLTWSLYIVHLMVASTLLVGGILAVMLKPVGRRLLLGVFVGAIVFELVRIVPTVIMALENMAIVEEYMPRLAEASNQGGQAPPGMDQTMGAFAKVGAIVGLVAAVAMMLFKCAFYVVGTLYLSKPRIVALYSQAHDVAGQGDWN